MNKIILIISLVCSISCSASAAPVTTKTLKTFIENLKDVNLNVEQTKYVKVLNKSFTSNSTFIFKKDIGFTWSDANHTFVANKNFYKLDQQQSKKLTDLPYFEDIKDIIQSVLNGNIKDINEIFDVTFSDKLILVPNISELSKWIAKIVVDMDSSTINSVTIHYQNGNFVLLKFNALEQNK